MWLHLNAGDNEALEARFSKTVLQHYFSSPKTKNPLTSVGRKFGGCIAFHMWHGIVAVEPPDNLVAQWTRI
jgi:hypothetical protein